MRLKRQLAQVLVFQLFLQVLDAPPVVADGLQVKSDRRPDQPAQDGHVVAGPTGRRSDMPVSHPDVVGYPVLLRPLPYPGLRHPQPAVRRVHFRPVERQRIEVADRAEIEAAVASHAD